MKICIEETIKTRKNVKIELKEGETEVIFPDDFNCKLRPGDIKEGITHVNFGFAYNQKLSPGLIPSTVKDLRFGYFFNCKLSKGDIPFGVTHLDLGYSFNQEIEPGVIPNTVEHLIFSADFNQKIKMNVIPNSVTHLKFGIFYDRILEPGVIPSSVTYLSLINYDHDLTGVIPPSVEYLDFNYPQIKTQEKYKIPSSVTHLFLFNNDCRFDIEDGDIPESVKCLILDPTSHYMPNIDKKLIDRLDDIYIYPNTRAHRKFSQVTFFRRTRRESDVSRRTRRESDILWRTPKITIDDIDQTVWDIVSIEDRYLPTYDEKVSIAKLIKKDTKNELIPNNQNNTIDEPLTIDDLMKIFEEKMKTATTLDPILINDSFANEKRRLNLEDRINEIFSGILKTQIEINDGQYRVSFS